MYGEGVNDGKGVDIISLKPVHMSNHAYRLLLCVQKQTQKRDEDDILSPYMFVMGIGVFGFDIL